MKTEWEVKFVDVDINEIRGRLESAGGVLEQPMRLMRRAILETPELKKLNAFVRVRDEGDKVTVTYKQFNSLSIDGAKEHEIVVNDFDKAVALLVASGLSQRSLQESKRETWSIEGGEVVIDEWPWLKPYIEVEGDSETHVKEISSQLDLNWSDAIFGDVMAAYRTQYPHLNTEDTVGNIAVVKFDDPLPDLLKNL